MTTKIITGTYTAGYQLNSNFSLVDITASGSIGGSGLVTYGNAFIQNLGNIKAQAGANGVTLESSGGAGGYVLNQSYGYIGGGQAYAASGAGAAGNYGGAGVCLYVNGTVNSGSVYNKIIGGGGGAGLGGTLAGNGGRGGNGVLLFEGGRVHNGGVIAGGAGGAGGNSSGSGLAGGNGGNGGVAVFMNYYGLVEAASGAVRGGNGGHAGIDPIGIGGAGGYGGIGVLLNRGGKLTVTNSVIIGGDGGAGGPGNKGGIGGVGVQLESGGSIINHGAIGGGSGGQGYNGYGGDGIFMGPNGGDVVNYGTIFGGDGGEYIVGNKGGRGGSGIFGVVRSNVTINNFGTIESGMGSTSQLSGYGVELFSSGYLGNGSASNHSATIEGRVSSSGAAYSGVGIFAGVGSDEIVNNFGTISGRSSVVFYSSSDVLVAEAGSVFSGAVSGGGGTLELGPGSGTVSGIDSNGNVTVSGFVGSAPVFQDFGKLEIAAGGNFAMVSAGTIASGKTLVDNGVISDAGALSVAGTLSGSGALSVTGKLTFLNTSSLSVANLSVTGKSAKVTVGASISYSGIWFQNYGTLSISGRRTFNLTNTADVISGKSLTVTGTLEVSSGGKLLINGPIANNGLLLVNGGTMDLEGASTVTGAGSVEIISAVFDAAGIFNQAVSFVGGLGTLILGHSQSYTANITGFSTAGGTELDLGDVGFVSAHEATFSGTTAGGVLTVTDGTHTAKLNLVGNFTGSTFTSISDGHGGVIVVDHIAGASAPPASTQAFVSAMAGMGGGGAAVSSQLTHATRDMAPMLLAPHV